MQLHSAVVGKFSLIKVLLLKLSFKWHNLCKDLNRSIKFLKEPIHSTKVLLLPYYDFKILIFTIIACTSTVL